MAFGSLQNYSLLKIVFETFASENHSVDSCRGNRTRVAFIIQGKDTTDCWRNCCSSENLWKIFRTKEMGFNKTLRTDSLSRGIPFFLWGGLGAYFFWCVFFVWFFGLFFDLDFWNRYSFGCTWKLTSACVIFLLNQTALIETGVKNHFAVGKARDAEFTRKTIFTRLC